MTNADPVPSHVEHQALHHEESDVNVRAILGFGAILFVSAVVIHVVIWLIFIGFERREARQGQAAYPLSSAERERVPPEPRLQVNPREDLRQLRAAQGALLESYGWVDRNAGVIRIPVSEAMRLTVERGLPARPEAGK